MFISWTIGIGWVVEDLRTDEIVFIGTSEQEARDFVESHR
jgi:hypothetical protein